MRWLLERTRDNFEDIGAENMTILDCGAVKFYDGTVFSPRNILIYAPGQWITICQDEDAV